MRLGLQFQAGSGGFRPRVGERSAWRSVEDPPACLVCIRLARSGVRWALRRVRVVLLAGRPGGSSGGHGVLLASVVGGFWCCMGGGQQQHVVRWMGADGDMKHRRGKVHAIHVAWCSRGIMFCCAWLLIRWRSRVEKLLGVVDRRLSGSNLAAFL